MAIKACPIQRTLKNTQLEFIMKHQFFDGLRDGIASGQILPTLRKDEVHFYEGGARLFRITGCRVFTHRAYIDGTGDKERKVPPEELCKATLESIRQRAVQHRLNKQADSELVAVHGLFPHFAITRCAYRPGELALIDVEARFEKDIEAPPGLRARMIDLVFLMPDRRLLFVEAKCVGNSDVRSRGTAAVVEQVREYERHIAREGVLDALNRSLKVQSRLVEREFDPAEGIFPRVPVLILDPTQKKISPHSTDTWLRAALALAGSPKMGSPDTLVIDGISTRPDLAIKNWVKAFI